MYSIKILNKNCKKEKKNKDDYESSMYGEKEDPTILLYEKVDINTDKAEKKVNINITFK